MGAWLKDLQLKVLEVLSTRFSEKVILAIIDNILSLIGIWILAYIALRLGRTTIDKLFKFSTREGSSIDTSRAVTLRTLLKSFLRYLVYFMALIAILEVLGIETKGILAGAGIVGLAVGFGAQNLVKDVITGFFIVFENHFVVGDYITTAGLSGVVEEFGLRITKVRDFGGELHVIPNGEITMVTNHSRGSMRALVDISVAYEEDITRVSEVLNDICNQFAQEFADIIVEGPSVLGIQSLGQSDVIFRIVARTKPMEQWNVERELRRRIKETFDQLGIEIPYSKTVLINADKGNATQEV